MHATLAALALITLSIIVIRDCFLFFFFFFNDTATTEIYTLSLHDALPISPAELTAVVQPLYRSGRGVYGMKALGSGQVTEPRAVASALRYAFDYPYAHAICGGITSEAEPKADGAGGRRARRSSQR